MSDIKSKTNTDVVNACSKARLSIENVISQKLSSIPSSEVGVSLSLNHLKVGAQVGDPGRPPNEGRAIAGRDAGDRGRATARPFNLDEAQHWLDADPVAC